MEGGVVAKEEARQVPQRDCGTDVDEEDVVCLSCQTSYAVLCYATGFVLKVMTCLSWFYTKVNTLVMLVVL